jgi:hypothetical protein
LSLLTSFSAPYAARPGRGKQRVQFVETPTIAGPSSSSVSGGDAVIEVRFLQLAQQFRTLEQTTISLTDYRLGKRNRGRAQGAYFEQDQDSAAECGFDTSRQGRTGLLLTTFFQITYSGPLLLARLPSKEALAVRRLAASLKFKGEKLGLSLQTVGPSKGGLVDQAAQKQKDKVAAIVASIRSFIRSRWSPDILMCDLTGLNEDPAVRRAGIRSLEDGNKTGEVVCTILGEICPDLVSLRADRLHLHSLSPFATILAKCPKLANLSLARNALPNLDSLLPLRNAPLNELILTGNPVRENEVRKSGGQESLAWRNAVKKIFPTLKILDDSPLGDVEEEMEEEHGATGPRKPGGGLSLPKPVKKGFLDGEETKMIVTDFVSK